MGDNLIDATSKRLRDTPPRDPERVLRRGEIIMRSSTNAASVLMPAGLDRSTAVRCSAAVLTGDLTNPDGDLTGLSVAGGIAHFSGPCH